MNIFVGNLSAEITGDELRREFIVFGEVASVIIMNGSHSDYSTRHGFVEMPLLSEGEAAITALNGAVLWGKKVKVIQALPLSRKVGHAFYDGSYGDKPGHWFSSRARQGVVW